MGEVGVFVQALTKLESYNTNLESYSKPTWKATSPDMKLFWAQLIYLQLWWVPTYLNTLKTKNKINQGPSSPFVHPVRILNEITFDTYRFIQNPVRLHLLSVAACICLNVTAMTLPSIISEHHKFSNMLHSFDPPNPPKI